MLGPGGPKNRFPIIARGGPNCTSIEVAKSVPSFVPPLVLIVPDAAGADPRKQIEGISSVMSSEVDIRFEDSGRPWHGWARANCWSRWGAGRGLVGTRPSAIPNIAQYSGWRPWSNLRGVGGAPLPPNNQSKKDTNSSIVLAIAPSGMTYSLFTVTLGRFPKSKWGSSCPRYHCPKLPFPWLPGP